MVKNDRQNSAAANDGVPPPKTNVTASIVPPHCSGYSFVFEPGVLHVKKDGSGYIVVNEDDFVLEDDRCEGPDGPEGSVHWIARMDASEITALRDFLNGAPQAHTTATLREALIEAKTWHQGMRKSCSKQPPSAMRDFAMATHAEQIEQIDAALSATTEGSDHG